MIGTSLNLQPGQFWVTSLLEVAKIGPAGVDDAGRPFFTVTVGLHYTRVAPTGALLRNSVLPGRAVRYLLAPYTGPESIEAVKKELAREDDIKRTLKLAGKHRASKINAGLDRIFRALKGETAEVVPFPDKRR